MNRAMNRNERNAPSTGGRAVADEDPETSPMDGSAAGLGPAQPLDIDAIEKDRAKSTGPRSDELRKS